MTNNFKTTFTNPYFCSNKIIFTRVVRAFSCVRWMCSGTPQLRVGRSSKVITQSRPCEELLLVPWEDFRWPLTSDLQPGIPKQHPVSAFHHVPKAEQMKML